MIVWSPGNDGACSVRARYSRKAVRFAETASRYLRYPSSQVAAVLIRQATRRVHRATAQAVEISDQSLGLIGLQHIDAHRDKPPPVSIRIGECQLIGVPCCVRG